MKSIHTVADLSQVILRSGENLLWSKVVHIKPSCTDWGKFVLSCFAFIPVIGIILMGISMLKPYVDVLSLIGM